MEDLATKNVEKVSNVATKVTDHNKKTWRSALATWTIIFAVLGSFLFCMMTIRMVPKQRNKCLLFCGTTPQKEVCNRMEDGSIVCVDAKGNPYVKKHTTKSRREKEDAGHSQECEVGNDGICVAPTRMVKVTNDAQEVGNAQHADTASDHTSTVEGECRAHYDDRSDGTECGEGECQAAEHDQVGTESSVDAEQGGVDEEHRQALEQVMATVHAENASLPNNEECDKEVDGHQPDEEISHQEQEEEEPERVKQMDSTDFAEGPLVGIKEDLVIVEESDNSVYGESTGSEQVEEQGSAGVEEHQTGGDHVEVECNGSDTEAAADDPVQEPATQSEFYQIKAPSIDKYHAPETSFKPAEIVSQYLHTDEGLDDHGNRIEIDKIDFSADDVHLAAHLGQNDLLKRYLYLKPHYGNAHDDNGWRLIHEAANEGQVETIAMLLDDYNADINARTGLINDGSTPLNLAYLKGYDDSSQVVEYIKSRGGVSIAPGENAPYKPLSEHTPDELEQYNLHNFHVAAVEGDNGRVAQYIIARPDLLE